MQSKVKVFISFIIPLLLIAVLAVAFPMATLTTLDKSSNRLAAASVWDGTNTMPSGAGTEASPYLISSAANLAWISANPFSGSGKYYRQTVDIDLASRAWTPINHTGEAYSYYYNGDGYKISNLYISSSSRVHVGLFGFLDGGYIRDTHIASGSVTETRSFGEYNMGGLVAYVNGGAIIDYCSNNASIAGKNKFQGGIAGQVGHGTIQRCWNTGNLTINSGGNNAGDIGGIVGCIRTGVVVQYCWNSGTVGTLNSKYSGGIAGATDGGTIQQCFSVCSMDFGNTGIGSAFRGGIVGYVFGTNPYVSTNYFDSSKCTGDMARAAGSFPGGTVTNTQGLSTAQMKSTANGSLPSGMTSFTAGQWHLVNGFYPAIRYFNSMELTII